jgi:hypothetical protein
MILTQKILDEILEYLEKSMTNLAKDAFENLELKGDIKEMGRFLHDQFDIRLENLLLSKNSSIHHLESSMKNTVIQRKEKILDKILK